MENNFSPLWTTLNVKLVIDVFVHNFVQIRSSYVKVFLGYHADRHTHTTDKQKDT